jgi:hypothetical protein
MSHSPVGFNACYRDIIIIIIIITIISLEIRE